jgi:hypothetical protein
MRKAFLAASFIALFTVYGFAVEGSDVLYAGGTVQGLSPGSLGKLDLTGTEGLTFASSSGTVSIPYLAMDSYQYSQEVARHLGVLPAIGTGLLRHRQKRHFLRVAFHDTQGRSQVVILEISKQLPRTLQAVLETRAPGACRQRSACAGR